MNEKNTFYITTPIFYPSNYLTLGNCYPAVMCDAIARFKKMQDKEVFFLTGSDEHGAKVEKVAAERGMGIKEHIDDIIADAKKLLAMLNVEYDRFIRTTDPDHVATAQKVFTKLYEKGYIYKSKYSGHYCTPCESFWTESQLVEGKCPDCGRDVVWQEEEAYFFKLSAFGDKLLNLYKENPEFLQPTSRVNEMVNNFIKPGLQDLCVSRTSVKWGIPVEFDPNHTIYVWIDALSNYISALGYLGEDDSLFQKFWPADLHLVGKEIVRFHAIIWPSILMALDLPLPKQVFGHGWLLLGGQKLSKSKEAAAREITEPRILAPKYSSDAVRYYLYRETIFGTDGTFSTEGFLRRVNSDLCNDFGNLVNRSLAMTRKYFGGVVPKQNELLEVDHSLIQNIENCKQKAFAYMEKYDVSKALQEIFAIFSLGNKYIEETMPWVLAKEDKTRLETVIYNLLETIKIGAALAESFIPDGAGKVLAAFGFDRHATVEDIATFGQLKAGIMLGEVPVLYPRLDIEKELEYLYSL